MSVREAQQRIDSREFSEWMAFWRVEPFGDEWRQAGVMAWASIAAMGGGSKVKPEGFMPVSPRRRKQSADEIAAALKAWALGVNGHNRNTKRQP